MSNTETITIDATDRKLGRVSTEIAEALMAKNSVHFEKNQVADVSVEVENASKLAISDTKLDTKTYDHYSGHPGGRKEQTARTVTEEKGFGEIIRRAVKGMLPKNKLQSERMKNLHTSE